MATQQVNPIQTPANALRAAIQRNSQNGPAQPIAPTAQPRITETGSPQAAKGVSLQDQVAQLTALVASLAAGKPARVAREPKAPKPAKVEETGPWYSRKAYLGRCDKVTGVPFYDVDFDSVLATEDLCIMRSNAYSNTLLFIKGKRKPVYLSASALGVLLAGVDTLTEFAKVNAAYLTQCLLDSKGESESGE